MPSGPFLNYTRAPQRVNVAPAQAARKANALLRRALEAQRLLEGLGCSVTWPPEPHEDIAAATIKR
jgi:hypothetical protein